MRFFTLYNGPNLSRICSAFIQDVWSIPNNQQKNARLSSLTLVIRTPTRDLKLNADNIQRHYQWLLASFE